MTSLHKRAHDELYAPRGGRACVCVCVFVLGFAPLGLDFPRTMWLRPCSFQRAVPVSLPFPFSPLVFPLPHTRLHTRAHASKVKYRGYEPVLGWYPTDHQPRPSTEEVICFAFSCLLPCLHHHLLFLLPVMFPFLQEETALLFGLNFFPCCFARRPSA